MRPYKMNAGDGQCDRARFMLLLAEYDGRRFPEHIFMDGDVTDCCCAGCMLDVVILLYSQADVHVLNKYIFYSYLFDLYVAFMLSVKYAYWCHHAYIASTDSDRIYYVN